MPKKTQKNWTAGQLKRRGWTNALIRDLLPEPRRMLSGGRYIRLWNRAEVLKAEEKERFRMEREPDTETRPAQSVADLLDQAWERTLSGFRDGTASGNTDGEPAARDGEPAARDRIPAARDGEPGAETAENSVTVPDRTEVRLAERYHRALLGYLRSGSGGRRLHASQAGGYLGEFLAIEKKSDAGGRYDASKLPELFKTFLRAGPWMEENPGAPVVQRTVEHYPAVLLAAADLAAAAFRENQPGASLDAVLDMENFPDKMLLMDGLHTVWAVWYVPRAIRTSLSLLLALNPKDEYPEARAMKRHFIIHLGGTNTGKTYEGFRRLTEVPTGVYLAPLRLLALEAQETLLDAHVDCGLTTGEEEDLREDDTHIAATAEKLDLSRRFDVAVIDECQMIADSQRGYAWTRAILGVQAPEVHLCAAPEAQHILTRIIESCGDTYEIQLHRRLVPLACMSRTVDFDHVQPGDALITFSRMGVLSVAEDLRAQGKEPAIIYGALPYAARRRQMEGFLEGKMQYVVATDAIGMGLNLPIRRIIFMETEKFDGVERRELKASEIKQIAGRAGRYGMYDKGWAGAMDNLSAVRAGLEASVPPIRYAVAGFSDLVLRVDFDLLEVLTEWSKMPAPEPYLKLDISRYISVITRMREAGFRLTREQELRAANIPFDETEEALRELFFHYLRLWQQGEAVELPELPEEGRRTLPELEQYYRKLDLYFSFAKAFRCPVDADALQDRRDQAAAEINDILVHRLRDNIRFCAKCGKALPIHHRGRLCAACFNRTRKSVPPWLSERRR